MIGDPRPALSDALQRMILVVDDDVLVRTIASEGLRAANFRVVEAANGDEARIILDNLDDIDLVFTDIEMPGSLDGVGLASWIANRYPGIKVLLTSGACVPVTRAELPFLPKPYRLRELVARILDLLP